MTQPIDLGKLQDAQHVAFTVLGKRLLARVQAGAKLRRAQDAFDACKKNEELAQKALDKAKEAVIEGARTVANG